MLLLSFVLCSTAAFASDYEQANSIILNDSELKLDVKPIIVEGRTMVPVRAILEKLGMQTSWDNTTRSVIGKKEDNTLEIFIGESWGGEGIYNGVKFHSEHAPNIIVKGRTLVSVRTIANLLGLEVGWDQANKNVILKETSKPKLTLKEAHDLLESPSYDIQMDEKTEYHYLPFGGYAYRDNYVLDNYYVFSINMYYEFEQDGIIKEDYVTADSNVCVNKNTGEIKIFQPDIGFE